MGRKDKVSPELKIKAVLEYMNGNGSYKSISSKYGVARTAFRRWIAKYKAQGKAAFIHNDKNKTYSSEFKKMVVQSYLSGEGSLQDIAIKYRIPGQDTVRQWVIKYNSHEELKASGTGGTIMTNGRKTTYDERIEIVKYCLEHNNGYAETAQKYEVSYQQVYTWTTKYEKDGVEALLDKRGKRKPEDEMSELEKLRLKNKLLEAENKRQQMEIDFLKKLKEIERGRY